MPAVIAPGIVLMAPIWQQEGQIVENTFHYKLAGAIDRAKLTAMANVYANWASTNASAFHAACILNKIYLLDLTSSTSASLEFNVVPAVNGTNPGGALPNNVTFALKRETGLRGRANRGRIYLIGLSQGDMNTGSQEIKPASANGQVSIYNALMAAMLAGPAATEVVLHRATGLGTNVIGYTYADLAFDSQRRRLEFHNRHH